MPSRQPTHGGSVLVRVRIRDEVKVKGGSITKQVRLEHSMIFCSDCGQICGDHVVQNCGFAVSRHRPQCTAFG